MFSFLAQQNKSRSGALKAFGLTLKRDAERKVNEFHAQMAFIRRLAFIRDVLFLVATSVIYSGGEPEPRKKWRPTQKKFFEKIKRKEKEKERKM